MTRDPQKRPPAEQNKLKPGESVLLEPCTRLLNAISRSLASQPMTVQALERAKRAIHLLEELYTYAVPAGLDRSRKELGAGRDALARIQSEQFAEEIFYVAGERRKGRPVKHRYVAAIALEAKRQNPDLTRRALAQRFCVCGKTRHTEQCSERLRRDIQRLNVLIRRILRDYPE